MRHRTLFVSGLSLALAVPALAGKGDLTVGQAAPGLDIESWLLGEETSLQKGQVYLVEFWATWCVPCRATMPHLTELQDEHADRGLTVIGISSEEPDVVKPWVLAQRGKMGYTVAVDRRQSTKRAWLDNAGLEGIPAAFIVDREGRIAFMGNPHPKADGPEMDRVLDKVLRGRYDPKLEIVAAPMLKGARDARKTRTWRIALKQYDTVIDLNPTVFADVALERFHMMLVEMRDADEAYAFAREKLIGGYFEGDDEALRMLAEMIAADPTIPAERRDLEVALESAQAAMKTAGRGDPQAYATLALVHYHRGEIDEAVRHQKRAWMLAKPRSKAEFRRVLKSYQAAAERTAGL